MSDRVGHEGSSPQRVGRARMEKDEGLILCLEDLHVHFPIYGGVLRRQVATVRALDGISLDIHQGETLGVVGESGCGKSTMGRTVIRLNVPTAGRIWYRTKDGRIVDLAPMSRREMRPIRAEIQMIFQDPYSSLNPRMTVGEIVAEPIALHMPQFRRKERYRRVVELLERVGLSERQAHRYPHEFSGGQRQRIGIARALSTQPRLIIADEPVSALDVSVQAQVINLMQDLQKEFGLTYIFIAHDLAVVQHISDRIAVMYLGNLAENALAEDLYTRPSHPYTRALLSAIPVADPRYEKPQRIILEGDVPSPLQKPSGCGFRTRCPIARPDCADGVPPLIAVGIDHVVACPYHDTWDETIGSTAAEASAEAP